MRKVLPALALALGMVLGCGRAAPAPPEPGDGAAARVDPPAPSSPGPANATAAPEIDPTTLDDAARLELARRIADEVIILDGHVDLPMRLDEARSRKGGPAIDVSTRTEDGDFDLPRARAGGLDAPFMSIYVPSKYEGKGAKAVADRLIDLVEGLAAAHPEGFALARSPAEIRANAAKGLVSLPMGMENGSPVESDLANVAHFHRRGIRYITLAHARDNHLSDASYDDRHTHGGLSPFGRRVVAEMNRLGIMVDVSHLSDEAFWDVLEASAVPVIASHSSCRHFTPGWERNMSDEMIRALARKGGVVQINFGSSFLDGDIRKARDRQRNAIEAAVKRAGLKLDDPAAASIIEAVKAEHPAPYATVQKVADHIDHVVSLVGVDHVGFGSDFEGVGDSLPEGLKDVSDYPRLIAELLRRGYRRADIEKICSGNVLRVWDAAEAHAAAH